MSVQPLPVDGIKLPSGTSIKHYSASFWIRIRIVMLRMMIIVALFVLHLVTEITENGITACHCFSDFFLNLKLSFCHLSLSKKNADTRTHKG